VTLAWFAGLVFPATHAATGIPKALNPRAIAKIPAFILTS
jgi:hypothetical protein